MNVARKAARVDCTPLSLITMRVALGLAEVPTAPKAEATAETENVATDSIVDARMLKRFTSVSRGISIP